MNHLLIVDGNNILIRSHSALRDLTRRDGTPSGGLFGGMRMFVSYVQQLQPTHVLWVFDKGKSEKRLALLPSYKGDRPTKDRDDSLWDNFRAFDQFLDIVGVKHYRSQGVEADDHMASAVHQWSSEDTRISIISGDHDLLQLVSRKPQVHLVRPKNGRGASLFEEIWTEDRIFEEYEMKPKDLPILWSLTGDMSDNIRGLHRVGEKTAFKLLDQHGSIDKILQLEKYAGQADLVRNNEKLIRLDGSEFPLPFDLDDCKFDPKGHDVPRLTEFLKDWDLGSFLKKVDTDGGFWK